MLRRQRKFGNLKNKKIQAGNRTKYLYLLAYLQTNAAYSCLILLTSSLKFLTTGANLDCIICIIWYSYQERNCGPYGSLKKKIFHVQILFANKIFLFFPVNPQLELMQNLKNDSLRPAIFSLSQELQERSKNTRDRIENPLVDLGISLGENFTFLDLYIIENAF